MEAIQTLFLRARLPDNPCPCDTDLLWWLSDAAIVTKGDSGRKDRDGKELQFFDVLVDSHILVESIQAVSAGALKDLGANISTVDVLDLINEYGATTSSKKIPKKIKDALISILLSLVSSGLWELIMEEIEKRKQGGQPK